MPSLARRLSGGRSEVVADARQEAQARREAADADGGGWSVRVRGRGVSREVAALIPPEDAEGK